MQFKSEVVYVLHGIADVDILLKGVTVKNKFNKSSTIDQVLLFAKDSTVLNNSFPKLSERLMADAILWIAYPKKSGRIKSDMSRDTNWDVVTKEGFIGVRQIAIDDDWSALRFRKAAAVGPKVRDIEQAKRKIEGVDFVNRKVILPQDAKQALDEHKELLALFNNMSFTHKKEYVESIVTAKKPETRIRRIKKMITLLRQYKASKKK